MYLNIIYIAHRAERGNNMRIVPEAVAKVEISYFTKKSRKKFMTGDITTLESGDYHFEPTVDSDIDKFYFISEAKLHSYTDSVDIMGDSDFATVRRIYFEVIGYRDNITLEIYVGIPKDELTRDGFIPGRIYSEINKIARCVVTSMADAFDYACRAAELKEDESSESDS